MNKPQDQSVWFTSKSVGAIYGALLVLLAIYIAIQFFPFEPTDVSAIERDSEQTMTNDTRSRSTQFDPLAPAAAEGIKSEVEHLQSMLLKKDTVSQEEALGALSELRSQLRSRYEANPRYDFGEWEVVSDLLDQVEDAITNGEYDSAQKQLDAITHTTL